MGNAAAGSSEHRLLGRVKIGSRRARGGHQEFNDALAARSIRFFPSQSADQGGETFVSFSSGNHGIFGSANWSPAAGCFGAGRRPGTPKFLPGAHYRTKGDSCPRTSLAHCFEGPGWGPGSNFLFRGATIPPRSARAPTFALEGRRDDSCPCGPIGFRHLRLNVFAGSLQLWLSTKSTPCTGVCLREAAERRLNTRPARLFFLRTKQQTRGPGFRTGGIILNRLGVEFAPMRRANVFGRPIRSQRRSFVRAMIRAAEVCQTNNGLRGVSSMFSLERLGN